MEDVIKLAVKLHGHLAPGVALGIRMSSIALAKLGANRGSRKLVAISETHRCLADAMQAATGCTLGHGNAFVHDYGKLAITLGMADTKEGVRVALKKDAHAYSPLTKKWMMREGKLTHSEEEELGKLLLRLEEKYFDIKEVKLNINAKFDSSEIVLCSRCIDLVPKDSIVSGLCKRCAGKSYYTSSQ
ncbi:MAG: hypothetical protein HY930_04775 [Euryarchaeota archaeon]|nr:hypothetical protein [Euryarchaeota archaeon]